MVKQLSSSRYLLNWDQLKATWGRATEHLQSQASRKTIRVKQLSSSRYLLNWDQLKAKWGRATEHLQSQASRKTIRVKQLSSSRGLFFLFRLCLLIVHILKMCTFYFVHISYTFIILRGVELFHPKMLRWCLVCVICNTNSFQFFIFKLCIMIFYTLTMCTSNFVHIE